MAQRGMRAKKAKAPKKLTYELIDDQPGSIGKQAYNMMRDHIEREREDLARLGTKIALAWCTSWKPDADGRVTIGKCRKASDLDRELMAFDFIILLNKEFWLNPKVGDDVRRAILDHELMHAAVKIGENGEPEEDAKGRVVYRIRKHDIEEFADTVRRHGIYRGDVDSFAQAIFAAKMRGYRPCKECKGAGTPGFKEIDRGGTTVFDRCACWVEYQQQFDPAPTPTPKPKQTPLPDEPTAGASSAHH